MDDGHLNEQWEHEREVARQLELARAIIREDCIALQQLADCCDEQLKVGLEVMQRNDAALRRLAECDD